MFILTQIEFWYWWVFALFLISVEVFAPGAVALWMGIAAAIVGGLLYLFPDMAWEHQILIFAVLSVISIVVWRNYAKRHPTLTDQPGLNKRGQDLIGQTLTLKKPLTQGGSRETINGVIWKIKGGDLPEGSKVRITSVEGTALIVEPEEAPS
ncbi:NfeD family protein [Kiloniella laminariae]|uniref:NfeD family protein n=1 Tax=Kiloniella laminariae TaxID=454162 RepID=A0ABT4LKY1_9PROT|nr:NfeD family protein [Kiloniella laminariae]MCZ4281763.1 NfeD family protein [Kiloniella laminariae]